MALTPPAAGPGHPLTHNKDDFVVLEFFWRRERKKIINKSQKACWGQRSPQGARSRAGIPGMEQAHPRPPGDKGKVGSSHTSPSSLSPGQVGTAGLYTAEHKDPMAPWPRGWNPTAVWHPGDGHCPQLHRRWGPVTSIPMVGLSPWWANGGCSRLGLAWPPQAPGVTAGSP